MDKGFRSYVSEFGPILDARRKFMFFYNAKTAHGSIVLGALKKRSLRVGHGPKLYRVILEDYSDLEMDNIFKFTIVRNPWDRTVSAFHFLQQYPRKKYNHLVALAVTFDGFVKGKLPIKGIEFNKHFHPQSWSVEYKGKIFADFIGRFEDLENDWRYIASKIGAPNELPHYHHNESTHKHYREYYDDETKGIIANLYRRDIELFGYEF